MKAILSKMADATTRVAEDEEFGDSSEDEEIEYRRLKATHEAVSYQYVHTYFSYCHCHSGILSRPWTVRYCVECVLLDLECWLFCFPFCLSFGWYVSLCFVLLFYVLFCFSIGSFKMSTQMEYDKWIFVAPPKTLEFTYGWWGGGGGGGEGVLAYTLGGGVPPKPSNPDSNFRSKKAIL